MTSRPIEQLPNLYWGGGDAVLVCRAYDDEPAWSLAVWDRGLQGWFLGNMLDFAWWVEEGYRDTPVEDREAMYLYEPTHFAEIPALPPRIGLH